jgi:hypothetical protein
MMWRGHVADMKTNSLTGMCSTIVEELGDGLDSGFHSTLALADDKVPRVTSMVESMVQL